MLFPIERYGLTFRLVEESDAAFILSLRTDKARSKHLSHTDNDLQKQINWIKEYKEREKLGLEYYVLFEDDEQEPLGVVRIYAITSSTYTSGSWLLKLGCDEFIGVKADIFISDFAYENLTGKICLFDVRKNNNNVLRYHKRFATIIGEDKYNYYFTVIENDAIRKRNFLLNII